MPTSSPRRVLGLLAAGTIGLSTALLGVSGVAHAEPGDTVTSGAEVAAALTVPTTPTSLQFYESGNGFVRLKWVKGAYDSAVQASTTGFEFSTDNGASWRSLYWEGKYAEGVYDYGKLSGLTNGTSYTFIVRATSAAGPSGESNAATGAPQAPIPAPANIVVTAVIGKVTVTWDPPPLPAGRGVVEYQADIVSVDNPNSSGEICTVHPGWGEQLICVYNGAPAGEKLEVQLGAWDEYGERSVLSGVIPVTVPFAIPAAVPTSNGALTPGAGSSDKVVAGTSMVLQGTGYRPGSTVELVIYSTPQVLTSVVADGGGNFTVTVTVPAGLAPGQHTLVASGVDTLGNARYTTLPVTVSTAGVATVASRKLAATGADVTVPLLAGVAALAVGGGLILGSRRRSAA